MVGFIHKARSAGQWIAALVILGVVFLVPHARMPAGPVSVSYPSPAERIATTQPPVFGDARGQKVLTSLNRDALTARFGQFYKENPAFQFKMQLATAEPPTQLQFSANNIITTFPAALVAPRNVGDVEVTIPTQQLLPYLHPHIVAKELPTLTTDFKKAREVRAAQLHTQHLVNTSRTNIDCAKMKCIALTFDDGPDGVYGPQIIKALNERRAAGTFFVVGSQVARHSSELRLAQAAGNEIGNHTWNHPPLTELSDRDIDWQIDRTNEAVTQATGHKPVFMRPPGGHYNAHTNQAVKMPVGLWNVDPRDWDHRDSKQTIDHTLTYAKPGAIILFHSIYPSTATAMPEIIDTLQQRGYVLVTMSELFGITPENYATFAGKAFL